MPRETITSTTKFIPEPQPGEYPEGATVANIAVHDLAVEWNKVGGWVGVAAIPKNWTNTGEWTSFGLGRDEIDHMIRALRRAKRQVWPTEVQPGVFIYEDDKPGVEPPSK